MHNVNNLQCASARTYVGNRRIEANTILVDVF